METRIREATGQPEKLEEIYRDDPGKFQSLYCEAFSDNKDSVLFRAWQARLDYSTVKTRTLSNSDLLIMLVICLCAGSILKIPDHTAINYDDYLGWMISLVPLSAMFMFTMHMRGWPRMRTLIGAAISTFMAVAILLLPKEWPDVYTLTCLNLPFLLWSLYGLSRLGDDWRSSKGRIEFLRFSGEFIIHSGLFFLGGGILLLLTFGLFDLLNVPTSWILEYPGVYGLASIPLVAAWATDTYSAARKLVPLLARIFSPLLLVLIFSYMGAMALNANELFQDRSTLLTYNILLLTVLATAIFTLTGRGEKESGKLATAVISLMVAGTIFLDLVGISAIGWRIFEYGITANRLTVLGSNLVVFGNLTVMGIGYLNYHKGSGTLGDIESALGKYLPAYLIWTGFSVLILPWMFRY
ncbi:hypothetical protein FMR86_11840 [Desulfovibrio sp. JC010]|nr:hypothetical protein [Desulfovibrio sp. JC010]